MFIWTDEMIKFYRRAVCNSDYNKKMAELIVEAIGTDREYWDLGCGMSHLSLYMAKYAKKISCVDVEEKVLTYLKEKAEEHNIDNLTVHNMDYREYIYENDGKGDCIIVSHFLNMKENLIPLLNSCNTLIIIKNNRGTRKWLKPHKKQTAQEVEKMIKKMGLNYKKVDYVGDFGQPLKSLDEAILYYKTYTGKVLSRGEIKRKLKLTGDKTYPYKMPKEKDIGIIIVEK
ncbi:MAG: class I SAM-dependent methyltransferase [Tissierellia bacterium]|nr:class I SAM-dependent methyltransferase [Tissierellia bacterium]